MAPLRSLAALLLLPCCLGHIVQLKSESEFEHMVLRNTTCWFVLFTNKAPEKREHHKGWVVKTFENLAASESAHAGLAYGVADVDDIGRWGREYVEHAKIPRAMLFIERSIDALYVDIGFRASKLKLDLVMNPIVEEHCEKDVEGWCMKHDPSHLARHLPTLHDEL